MADGGMMGDLSSEPSMEDILSSIKRIIAEEGEATPGRGRRAGRPAPPMSSDDEVLELSNPMPRPQGQNHPPPDPQRAPEAIRAEPARSIDRSMAVEARADPAAVPEAKPAEADRQPERAARPMVAAGPEPESAKPEVSGDPIVSPEVVEATRGALDQLSRLLVKPEPRADGTLEGLVREMLRPMLREWLDARLPALVEEMVAREIDRITSSRR